MDDQNILIADDEAIIRTVLERALEREHPVLLATNGAEALEAARDAPVALAIIDIQMPEPDGIAVARALLNQPCPPCVILMSALFSTPSWGQQVQIPEGIFACLAKPFRLQEVQALVGQALATR